MTSNSDNQDPGRAIHPPIVEQAMRLAASAHRHQVRKGSDLPYIAHPASVALILERAGLDDENLLAAALLHDVVEDTSCTLADVARNFPPAVVELVDALSEKKLDEAGGKRPWEDRKRDHLEVLRTGPFGARAIALADKLHNIESLLWDLEQDGPGVWERFNALPDRLLAYHRAVVSACNHGEPELRPLVDACNSAITRLEAMAPKK